MPSAAALSPAVAKLKAEYQRLYGKPASGPQRNQTGWLKQKIADKQAVSASVQVSPADDAPSEAEAVPNKIAEIDTFLTSCPVQFHADKLEERSLRVQNYNISKVKNAKAGYVKRLEGGVRTASRNLASARLPYSELKRTALGKAMLEAIAPFAKDDDFISNVKSAADTLTDYRVASIEAAAAKAKHALEQQQLLDMESEFQVRARRADELSASVAASVRQMELEQPKPRGRPPLRRASTISLGFDGEEAFSSAEEAAAAMANLTGAENLDSERDKFSQTMTFGDSDNDSDEEGEEY
jgi:hypothetical protein